MVNISFFQQWNEMWLSAIQTYKVVGLDYMKLTAPEVSLLFNPCH